jgi:hypothetical protein
MVALELLVMDAVVPENVAEMAPPGTMTHAGIVRVELVFDNWIRAPLFLASEGGAWDRVTVHVVEEFGPRLEGLHPRDDTDTDGTRVMVVLAELLL